MSERINSSGNHSPVPVQEIPHAFRKYYSATGDVPREIRDIRFLPWEVRDIRDVPWEISNSSIYLHTGTGNRNARQMSSSSTCCCNRLTITILFVALGLGGLALLV